MKNSLLVLVFIFALSACKSTQSTASSTEESEKKTEEVARPADLDLSKKVELQQKTYDKKADPKQVQPLDRTKIQKMSIEKRDNNGKN